MRLGKKKEKETDTKCQTVDNIIRLVCSYKSTQSPLKGKIQLNQWNIENLTMNFMLTVSIDGIELSGVKFFQLSTQWQTQIKFFPVVIFSSLDNIALSPNSMSASLNNANVIANSYKTQK